MKITEKTKQLLHNFRLISNSIVFTPGNTISIVHNNRVASAEATISETFPQEFAISDLKKFLDILKTDVECDVEFHDNHVEIRQSDKGKLLSTTNVIYANKNFIQHKTGVSVPTNDLVTVKLSASNIKEIYRISNVLMLEDMLITGDEKNITLKLVNKSVKGLNDSFELDLGENKSGYIFRVYFKIMHLRLLEGDYTLHIRDTFTEFVLDSEPVKYWLSNEQDSVFKEIEHG